MKGNYWMLLTAAMALLVLVMVAIGAHIYRWEFITWLCVGISNALVGYWYSRQLASRR